MGMSYKSVACDNPKLYISSALNTDFIFWHPQWIVFAVKYEFMV